MHWIACTGWMLHIHKNEGSKFQVNNRWQDLTDQGPSGIQSVIIQIYIVIHPKLNIINESKQCQPLSLNGFKLEKVHGSSHKSNLLCGIAHSSLRWVYCPSYFFFAFTFWTNDYIFQFIQKIDMTSERKIYCPLLFLFSSPENRNLSDDIGSTFFTSDSVIQVHHNSHDTFILVVFIKPFTVPKPSSTSI